MDVLAACFALATAVLAVDVALRVLPRRLRAADAPSRPDEAMS
ncbi:MAG TPA: hypothetical protein VF044_03665 [Actinomycetota bacterium]